MTLPPFAINFDYRCPFARIMHLHVLAALDAGADLEVTFEPWSLNQAHRAPGEIDVWENPERDDDLYALAAGVSVRDHQPDLFTATHAALFNARHVDGLALKKADEVLGVLAGVGVDTDAVAEDIATRRPHKVIGEAHHRLAPYEPFGVPTFFVGDQAVFVRYMSVPGDDASASVALVERLVSSIVNDPDLNEYKHTRITR
jgi:hypothetical protein